MLKCNNCGIEGIHACLGKPIKKEDLPEGVEIMNSGDLTSYFIANAGKATQKKEVFYDAKRRQKGELDLTKNDALWIVCAMILFGSFVLLALGG